MSPQNAFILRKFLPEDLAAVIQINRLCLPENYTSFFFLEVRQSFPEGFLVAEIDRRVVGYVMCRVEHGFSEVNYYRIIRKGHIVSVAVLPGYRRIGIGSALVAEVAKAMIDQGVGECFLEVRVTNQEAIELYTRLGFSVSRRAPHYYYDGEDAYVMWRELDMARVGPSGATSAMDAVLSKSSHRDA